MKPTLLSPLFNAVVFALMMFSVDAVGQDHCRVRYQYNSSGDRIQRDWYCGVPHEPDTDDLDKSKGVLETVHMQVSPNPATDHFLVALPSDALGGIVQLVNGAGAVVAVQRTDGPLIRIDVAALPDGPYFIRYSLGTESIVSSCVVQR